MRVAAHRRRPSSRVTALTPAARAAATTHPPIVRRTLRAPRPAPDAPLQACGPAHPHCGCPDEAEHLAARAELSAGSVPGVAGSRGAPLPGEAVVRAGRQLRMDASGVRVHDDAAANAAAARIGARAFTVGEDIYFAAGEYRPGSAEGRRLLGHELGHVRQQHAGLAAARGHAHVRAEERDADAAGVRFARAAAPGGVRRQAAGGATPAHTDSDCDDAQSAMIAAALPTARAMVDEALRLTQYGHAKEADIRRLLRKYFSDDGISTILHVRIGLIDIQRGLRRSLTLECEQPGSFMFDWFCGEASAYVRHPPLAYAIHLCPGAFASPEWLATTIVHEVSHLHGWTGDHQYCSPTAGCSLDRWDAYDNADSYAEYAREIHTTL